MYFALPCLLDLALNRLTEHAAGSVEEILNLSMRETQ